MPPQSAVINVMEKAARKAARGLRRDFGEVENLQVSKKGPADFVSAADLRAEDVLREELERARPGYGFLMEEAGAIPGADKTHRWIVDPLDGTTNFLHGLGHYAISIALEREGQLVAGLVFDPIKDEIFWGEKGKGAFVNGHRLRVAARGNLSGSLIATGIPFKGQEGHERTMRELLALTPRVAGIRRFGAASLDLAYVAAGRFDGFWEHGLHPWDIAAGIVLVREAGGMVGDMTGRQPFHFALDSILVANEALFAPLSAVLTGKAG